MLLAAIYSQELLYCCSPYRMGGVMSGGYLQFFTPSTFRSRVLSSGGERGKVYGWADVRGRLHPETRRCHHRTHGKKSLKSPSSGQLPGLCTGLCCSTFSAAHGRRDVSSAHHVGLLQHRPGQRLALHHGGLRLAGVAPLPVLLVPRAGLLLLHYFSVLVDLTWQCLDESTQKKQD